METEVLTTVITAVFAIISPVVIQWRKQPGWPTLIKVGLPVLVSLVIAIGYLMASGALAEQQLLPAFLIVYGVQQLVYSVILKNLAGFLGNDGKHEAASVGTESDDTPSGLVSIPRAQLEGWSNSPPLTGTNWREFAETLPPSEQATALLSVADAMDRDQQ